jgi:hypothetical protein
MAGILMFVFLASMAAAPKAPLPDSPWSVVFVENNRFGETTITVTSKGYIEEASRERFARHYVARDVRFARLSQMLRGKRLVWPSTFKPGLLGQMADATRALITVQNDVGTFETQWIEPGEVLPRDLDQIVALVKKLDIG